MHYIISFSFNKTTRNSILLHISQKHSFLLYKFRKSTVDDWFIHDHKTIYICSIIVNAIRQAVLGKHITRVGDLCGRRWPAPDNHALPQYRTGFRANKFLEAGFDFRFLYFITIGWVYVMHFSDLYSSLCPLQHHCLCPGQAHDICLCPDRLGGPGTQALLLPVRGQGWLRQD